MRKGSGISPIRILLAAVLLVVLMPAVTVFASDTTGAKWTGSIQVSNNGSSLTNQVVLVSINATNLINQGLLDASATNYAIQSGGSDLVSMPGYNGPWAIFQPSIPASGIILDTLFTPATGATVAYIPGPSGMSVSDSASMDPGSSFQWTIPCYVNLASTQPIINKEGACKLAPNGSGNVTFVIYSSPTTENQTSTSTGHAVTVLTAISQFSQLTGNISNVTAWITIHDGFGGVSYTAISIGGTSYNGSNNNPPDNASYSYSTSYDLNPKTGSVWDWATINAMLVGGYASGNLDTAWIVVTYYPIAASVSQATTSGFHLVTVGENATAGIYLNVS